MQVAAETPLNPTLNKGLLSWLNNNKEWKVLQTPRYREARSFSHREVYIPSPIIQSIDDISLAVFNWLLPRQLPVGSFPVPGLSDSDEQLRRGPAVTSPHSISTTPPERSPFQVSQRTIRLFCLILTHMHGGACKADAVSFGGSVTMKSSTFWLLVEWTCWMPLSRDFR